MLSVRTAEARNFDHQLTPTRRRFSDVKLVLVDNQVRRWGAIKGHERPPSKISTKTGAVS